MAEVEVDETLPAINGKLLKSVAKAYILQPPTPTPTV